MGKFRGEGAMKLFRISGLQTALCWLCCIVCTASAQDTAPRGDSIHDIRVLPEGAADCTSLEAIVNSVTRGCETNDERAIAIYNFMRLTHYHRAYPSEPGGIPVLKEIHCYGWSLCGGLHAEQSALWRAMGWDWRFVGWPGHTTVEAFYDGRWHYLDVFLKFYAWMPDPQDPSRRTIAGQDDLAADPEGLIFNAFVMDPERRVVYAKGNEFSLSGATANWQAPAFLTCGDDLAGVAAGVRRRNRVGPEPGWAGMRHDSGGYSAEVDLAPGFALTNSWDAAEGAWYWADSEIAPCHTCGDKEIRNSPEKGPVVEPYLGPDWTAESYANGELNFRADFSQENVLQSFHETENASVVDGRLVPADPGKPGRVTVRLQSPYIMTQGSGIAEGVQQCEVRVGDGLWQQADLADFGELVGGHTQALLRLTFRQPVEKLQLQATIQNNPFALPFLSPGRNTVHVSVADPQELGENRLVVTYAYRIGSRRKSYEELWLEGKEIARAHNATWDDTPIVVQREFTAADLPGELTIDIPTPSDQHPVYPRMLFVRREILAPGQQPLPLPEGAQSPRSRSGDELKTLPSPFLTGIRLPARQPQQVRMAEAWVFPAGRIVDTSGAAATGDFLKWPKAANESVPALMYLIESELPDLPAAESLAAARLTIPVTRGHAKAPTRLGLYALQEPATNGAAVQESQLGDALATAIVPTLADDADSWSPPRMVRFDITRYIQRLLLRQQSGQAAHHGFAVRVIPDRSVDDGWTVRVHLPETAAPRLELETAPQN